MHIIYDFWNVTIITIQLIFDTSNVPEMEPNALLLHVHVNLIWARNCLIDV